MNSLGQIYALLRVQWQSLWNTFQRGDGRRGLLLSMAVSLIWHGLWIVAAVGSAIIPSFVGYQEIQKALPGLLFMVMAYWQLAPLLTMSLGASLQMRKVAIYPISVPTLFIVECLLRLGTGSEMVLLLLGLFVGLGHAGSPHMPQLALAFLLFILFNTLLSAGIRNSVERLCQRRKLREVVVILLVSSTVLPQLLVWSERARDFTYALLETSRSVPYWIFPSSLAGRIGTATGSAADLWLLAGMTAAAGIFGFVQFRGGCRPDGVLALSPRTLGWRKRWRPSGFALQLSALTLADPLAALVEKEIRYLWRSPRFRLPFFMGFTFGVIAWVPLMRQWESTLGRWMEGSAVALMSLYALLLLGPVLFLNRFGFDRGAARFYFWLPLSSHTLLLAKNLASLFFCLCEVALVALACVVIGHTVGVAQVIEAFGISLIALLYLLSVGNYMSVRFPRMVNPDRVSRSGPGHGITGAVQFLLFPLALAPVFGALLVRYRQESAEGFLLALALAAAGGVLVYLAALDHSARYAEQSREILLGSLSQDEGPIAAE